MAEATGAAREPRYWKITLNPEECPKGAWKVCRATGLAMLGLPGDLAESGYAVRNMKRVREGDWLVAYTPQEGAYTVGGVGRVTRGYCCEEGPFDHPWNGPVRRSLGVEWHAGACRIADLVKDGRFRKGKIPRILDEISAEEFGWIRERVLAAATTNSDPWSESHEALLGEAIVPAADPEPVPTAPLPRTASFVLDPRQEQPPLPEFFLEWVKEDKILGPDIRAGCTLDETPDRRRDPEGPPPEEGELARAMAETSARRAREAHLLSSFAEVERAESVLDFGLPTMGDADLPAGGTAPGSDRSGPPSEVRVGAMGWTGLFRREVESGRPCCLILRGPQYSFLNMTPSGTTLRGLPLFALFAIGAVAAPGKEAYRSGATFIFRGRRASGDYEVEVRPRGARPTFREPAEAAN